MNVLRRRAHLGGEPAQHIGEAIDQPVQIVRRLDDHAVASSRFRIDQLVAAILFDPRPEALAAGIVDDRAVGVLDQVDRRRLLPRIGGQQHKVRIEPGARQNLPAPLHRHRHRQDAVRVRFQDHRIAGHQVGEDRRIGVPHRKRRAADHHRHAARPRAIGLFQTHVPARAEILFPLRFLRDVLQRLVAIGQRLHPAIQRVRPAA